MVDRVVRCTALALLLASASACTTLVKSPQTSAPVDRESALAAYARVLDRYVNDAGEVDFAGLARNRADLDRYVAFVARTPAGEIAGRRELLAHYINSYNALSIYNVLDSGIPATHAGLNKLQFFALKKHTIGGETLSLYAFENDLIRKLAEPRIHFALNCSARSCPVLPRLPFGGAELDAELERETIKFFASERNLRLDHAERIVWASEILRFYREDFVPEHAPNLIAYLNRYGPQPIPEDYRLQFIDYDWRVANWERKARRDE